MILGPLLLLSDLFCDAFADWQIVGSYNILSKISGNISVKRKKKASDGGPKSKKSKLKLIQVHQQQVNHFRNVNR